MTGISIYLYWWRVIGIAIGSIILLTSKSTFAQIVPDRTLPTQSTVRSQDNTRFIEGGTRAGNNLFHSFTEFSVPINSTAFFNSPQDIQNIITRVTGSARSDINGLIKADGIANLFLINPNGIVFGANSSLDIRGSFVASTASSLKFANGTEFSTISTNLTAPLLTIGVPIGLQYGNAGDIQLQGANLGVNPGRTLALVGGNVTMDKGLLIAQSGRIELGGLKQAGTVTLNTDTTGNIFSLNYPTGIQRGDLSIIGAGVASNEGGSISINARNLDISKAGVIAGDFQEGLGKINTVAGDINVDVTDNITINGGSVITTSIKPKATGNAGNINIQASSLNLLSGSQLFSSTAGQGNSGNIKVNVRDKVVFDSAGSAGSTSGIINSVDTTGVGKGGNVTLDARSVSLNNGAQLSVSSRGKGDAGNITINARDTVSFDGSATGIINSVDTTGVGKGGDVTLDARSVTLNNGAQLNISTNGKGDAGNVTINAGDTVSFDGSTTGIINSVDTTGIGKGGNVTLDARSVTLNNGAQLNISTKGKGDAGNVTINAGDTVSFDGSTTGIINSVDTTGIGKGGNVTLDARSVTLNNGAQLNVSTKGKGDAGNVTINAGDTISFDGSATGIINSVDTTGVGKGGNVTLDARSVTLNNGAQLNVSTKGKGDAGNVTINARDRILLSGENQNNAASSGIFTTIDETGVGNGGKIDISTNSLTITKGAGLYTLTNGKGNSGDILIEAIGNILIDGVNSKGGVSGLYTSVTPNAVGDAGQIKISTGSLTLTSGAALNTLTKGQGSAGNVYINARNTISFDGTNQNGGASGIFTTVDEKALGNGGDINIETGSLSVTGGAGLFALTRSQGNGGNVNINARNNVSFDGTNQNGASSGIFSSLDRTENSVGVGKGGDISITTNLFSLSRGAGLFAVTKGQGDAGNININARKQISLDGNSLTGGSSGIYSTVEPEGIGNGKEIRIVTQKLFITNGALVSSTSAGDGAAGNITIDANSIRLNRGTLSSNTVKEQGNINLRSTDLVLRNGSRISTNATGKNVIGGNININTGVLAGFENSDITANSIDFRGGNVRINTEGIFGIQFRDVGSLLTSDITATGANSELSGNVEITTPDVDPTSSLVELPVNLVDASRQISNACTPGTRQYENTFIATGRGGLPISPTEPLQENNTLSAWVKLVPTTTLQATKITPSVSIPIAAASTIIEASGWIADKSGNIELVASESQFNLHSPKQKSISCPVSR